MSVVMMDAQHHQQSSDANGEWQFRDAQAQDERESGVPGSSGQSPMRDWSLSPDGRDGGPGGRDVGDDDHDDDGSQCRSGMGLMEAFEDFHQRAERRVKDLLVATDAELFDPPTADDAATRGPREDLPPHVLLSDAYRLAQPPEFDDWRRTFPYFQIVGTSAFDEAPEEHIQIRSPLPIDNSANVSAELAPLGLDPASVATASLVVCGQTIHLRPDPSDPPQEELILADGEMEEVLEEDWSGDDLDGSTPPRPTSVGSSCLSPRASRVEEMMDDITRNCFTSIVIPQVTALVETMLKKQQHALKTSRESHEAHVQRELEAARIAREEQKRRELQEAEERRVKEVAIAKALEEERIREEQRREEMERLQREENDEEEIKIRTLAYTHTREWYQPNKKCFSHRGRKMTYLKPVLKSQGTEEHTDEAPAASPPTLQRKPTKPMSRPRKRRISSPQDTASPGRPSDEILPPPSPSHHEGTVSTTNGSDAESPARSRVRLPLLVNRDKSTKGGTSPMTSRVTSPATTKANWDDRLTVITTVHVPLAAPNRVYSVSPYRIPPSVLRAELKRDGVATSRSQSEDTVAIDD